MPSRTMAFTPQFFPAMTHYFRSEYLRVNLEALHTFVALRAASRYIIIRLLMYPAEWRHLMSDGGC